MKPLKIAVTAEARKFLLHVSGRDVVSVSETDFTDVAALVVTATDTEWPEAVAAFGIPVISVGEEDADLARRIEVAAARYEAGLLPPFFRELCAYVGQGNAQFDCPGHQGGAFHRRHPAGRLFYEFFGENLFRADLCNADVALGDLLIHEGPALSAQQYAARVFGADKTYFVLNGTSAANKVVTGAILTPGDLVLFDRNNHKSVAQGALLLAGATPVYLETARNPYGSIGGIPAACLEEDFIRGEIAKIDPEKARAARPIRLAAIQLGTYDGCLYDARYVLDKIGPLCDYIFFDSAWVGYEAFLPLLRDGSPLRLSLSANDPGIFVTQSVHKQQAGFSQVSQIHKKDAHCKGSARYVPHARVNDAFMLHASTSPCYPLFAALSVNAKMHEGKAGEMLWSAALRQAIAVRKEMLSRLRYLRPFVPPVVHGRKWEEGETEEMAQDPAYWSLSPKETWHGFSGYDEGQYRIDPMKLLLTTKGIDAATGAYEEFGIPGAVLAEFLRENGIIPEKSDLHDILFLLTPAETEEKMKRLMAALLRFETLADEDAPLAEALPELDRACEARYHGYTLKTLCQEMHDFYKERNLSSLQTKLFQKEYRPEIALHPKAARELFLRGEGVLTEIAEAEGRIALEGALPYPPGVLCVYPGERWTKTAVSYFESLAELAERFPGFTPEIQGVHLQKDEAGRLRAYGYVMRSSDEE